MERMLCFEDVRKSFIIFQKKRFFPLDTIIQEYVHMILAVCIYNMAYLPQLLQNA